MLKEHSEVILETRGLSGIYKTYYGVFRAVDRVDLKIFSQEIMGLVGESGSGKSTLMKLITGAPMPPLYYEEGEVVVKGIVVNKLKWEELRHSVLGRLVAYVPQSTFDALYPFKRVWQFYLDMFKERGEDIDEKEAKERLVGHFEDLGLDPSAIERYPFELSGGMKQRTVIAIVVSLKPSLLMLDEPTSALDVITQRRVLEFIADIFKKRYVESMLISSHDIATLRQITHRLAVMYAGVIMEIGDTDEVINEPLHPYTKLLIESILPLDRFESRKKYRIKAVPYSINIPISMAMRIPGCRFHSRCPYATDRCRREEPLLTEVRPGRFIRCWLYIER